MLSRALFLHEIYGAMSSFETKFLVGFEMVMSRTPLFPQAAGSAVLNSSSIWSRGLLTGVTCVESQY